MTRRLVSLPLLVLLLATYACSERANGDAGGAAAGGGAPPPLPVEVGTAERGTASLEVIAAGSLRSPETTTVASDVAGILVELNVPEGSEVPAGHLLARIDPAEARAALQVAEARHENARIALERAQSLFNDGVSPRQTVDDAVAEMRTAEGLLQEAQTAVQKTEIRAPFAGRLGIHRARLGQRVAAGDPIVQITQLDPLELTFGVPEADAAKVAVGQSVAGRVGRCGDTFEGKVVGVDPTLDAGSRSLLVLARVPNGSRALRPGMSARVVLRVGKRDNALIVPQESLVRQGSRYVVWRLDEQNVAQPAPVSIGSFSLTGVEILEGLQEGDRVVVAGHQKLRPGATVMPMPWQPTENPLLELGLGGEENCD